MQLSNMATLVSQRLAEGQDGPTYYPNYEIVAALNEAQRLFCLLTLALEKTASWGVPIGQPFTHMLTVFPDWIVPLRLTSSAGAKIRPARIEELTALDSQWIQSPGSPVRYAALGADLLALYQQPAAGLNLSVTYARAPVPLVNDTDNPEIPVRFCPKLVDYGIYRMRQAEGAQEFAKALPLLGSFLDGAQEYGKLVRAQNEGSHYDAVPFELAAFDRSELLRSNEAA